MALFRRNKDSVLPEVDKYYEAEKRDRTGVAWLLALVSVAVVALIIVGLFLGGRWAYNKIAKNNDAEEVAQVDENGAPSFDNGEAPTGDTPAPADGTGEAPAPAPNGDESQGTVNAPARTETPSTPVTGDSGELPSTGPADTALIFATVSTAAGAAHYAVTKRKLNR